MMSLLRASNPWQLVLASLLCGTACATGDPEPDLTGSSGTAGSSTTAEPQDDTSTGAGMSSSGDPATGPADSTSTTDDPDGSSSSGGEDPLAYAGEMNGYRWELPCEDPSLRDTCPWDPALLEGAIDDPTVTLHRETLVVFGGDPAVIYDVEIRLRGLTEPKTFTGGEVQAEHFQIGGTPDVNDYNIYAIDVGDPAQRYTLNRNAMPVGHYTFIIDYTVTIPVRGGTEVRMTMIDPNNIAIANPGGSSGSMDPFVVPEIAPFPEPFYGQFIQMDVLSVTPQG
jgi:hypothetical protein